MLFYSKCTGFTFWLNRSDISLSIYKTMLTKRWITLPVVDCRPLASKAVFELFWKILSSPFGRNSKRRTHTPSKLLKKPLLKPKDDSIPQVTGNSTFTTRLWDKQQIDSNNLLRTKKTKGESNKVLKVDLLELKRSSFWNVLSTKAWKQLTNLGYS